MRSRGGNGVRFAALLVTGGVIAQLPQVSAAGVIRARDNILASQSNQSLIVPVAVFGTDDRTVLPPNLKPLRESLGVLFNIRLRTVCTAFCVAHDIIGTAAHCLYRTKGEKAPKFADYWFARNYDAIRDYSRIAGFNTGTSAQNIIAGSASLSTTPPIDATRDWAFVRLATPVCNKGVFEIRAMPPEKIIEESKARHIYQISYHKDFKQWQPAFSQPCAVDRSFSGVSWTTIAADFAAADKLVLHTCDTGGASSGSPLLLDTEQGPKVVGINVSTYVQSRKLMRGSVVSDTSKTEVIANTGVASIAFAEQLAAFRSARVLAGAGALREMQERLKRLGYYSGPIDGTYGQAMQVAIVSFQAQAKLFETGLASEDVLTHLRLLTARSDPASPPR